MSSIVKIYYKHGLIILPVLSFVADHDYWSDLQMDDVNFMTNDDAVRILREIVFKTG